MNRKSTSISIPLPVLLAVIVALVLFAGGLNVGSFLSGEPSFVLASAGAGQAGQPSQSQAKGKMAPESMSAGSSILYQGSLKRGGTAANGPHDFRFTLYDALEGGNVVAPMAAIDSMPVTNGLFTAPLDFGPSAFNGDARYLQVEVRQERGESYSTLDPRQPIAPAPYALFAAKTQPQKNVVTVAQAGGQFTSIQAALNSITDASDANRYVVRVAPGTYTERVTMKQYVDIEGSGEKTTGITFTGSGSIFRGTVIGASNAELRSLTVKNTGDSTYATAIANDGVGTTMSLFQVTATASGGGVNIGVYIQSSSPMMTNVTATASGAGNNYGVGNFSSSSPTMTNVTATASGGDINIGMWNNLSSPTINNSSISGGTNSIYHSSGGPVKVGASQLNGGPVLGSVTCAGVYDENYTFYASTCP